MPNRYWLIAATAALAAAPAAAQNEVADQPVANAANEVTTTDMNLVTTTEPTINALEPAPAPMEPELSDEAAADDDGDHGFPWGLIGLVGLIGLLGRRRSG